jgi:hypothetical protein
MEGNRGIYSSWLYKPYFYTGKQMVGSHYLHITTIENELGCVYMI